MSSIPRPLAGVKVLDLSRLLAGPYCAMILADMGAEVIKLEPVDGEDCRFMGNLPELNGESFMYVSSNINKKSIAVNLEAVEGQEIIHKLIAESDVVIENFLPRVKEKLSLFPDELIKSFPELIYCSITAFGARGPYQNKPGLDVIFQALGGLISVSGEPDGPPVKAGAPVADMAAAILSALAIVTALLEKQKIPKGKLIEISLLESLIFLQGPMSTLYFATGKDLAKVGTGSHVAVPSQAFETADGYITISAFNNRMWARLCSVLGKEFLADDSRFSSNDKRLANRWELIKLISELTIQRTSQEWLAVLEDAGIPCSPIYSYSQLFQDPQVEENKTVRSYLHPQSGNVKMISLPFKFDGMALNEVNLPAPLLGEHTEEIMASLGYTTEVIAEYRRKSLVR